MLGALMAVEGSLIASGIVIGLICAAVGWWIGDRKGRPFLGFILGLILGIIGLLIMLIVPARHDTRGGWAPPAPG